MRLTLRKLDFKRCFAYFTSEYSEGLFFSEKITQEEFLKNGDFFTIVPDTAKEEDIYKFQWGGFIYPFNRPPEVTILPVRNDSASIIDSSLIKYLRQSSTHFIGMEDFSKDPNSSLEEIYGLKYYLLQNNKLFYLLDYKYTDEGFAKFKRKIKDYLSLCLILKLPSGFTDSIHYINPNNRITNQIFAGITSFFIGVYDGEGYLIWVSKSENSYLEVISEQLTNDNNI